LRTAVPFLVVFLAVHPMPTARRASGGGPPPQVPRAPGQPPGTLSAHVLPTLWGESASRRLAHPPKINLW